MGRGPLAGDVVTAAVILDPARPIDGLNDSKQLSEKRRDALYDQIVDRALCYCVARASVAEIDRMNILQATMTAMRRAVMGLKVQPDYVAVDGNRLPQWEYRSEAIIKGDGRVACISAASIVAKVVRDREMVEYDQQFPGYGFAQHKGYGTRQHLDAIATLGPSPIHRLSFAPLRADAPSQPGLL